MKNPFTIQAMEKRDNKQRSNWLYVGGHLPPDIAENLALVSLTKAKYKTDLIREAIEQYLKKEKLNKKQAIEQLRTRAQITWDMIKKAEKGKQYFDAETHFKVYVSEIHKRLSSRGLTKRTINSITKGLKV